MRTLNAIAFVAAASFAALAQAQTTYQTPADTSVRVTGATMAPYRVDSERFSDYKGTYELSNGKYMVVMNRGRRFFAEIDGERRAELIPVGHNVFIARDRDMMMMFDEVYNGHRNDVVIRSRRQVG